MPETIDQLPPFVGAAWLADHLDQVQLVDVRWALDGSEGHHTYLEGHLPGAVYVDLPTDLADPPSDEGGRNPLPDAGRFAQALGARGLRDDAPVVAYDTLGGAAAGRLVWSLRVTGQAAAVLDGGLAAWSGPLHSGEVTRPPVTREVRPWPADRLVDADAVAALADGAGHVVDVRSAARFRGEADAVDPRAGHVPGAVNLPVADHLRDGRLRAPEDLRAGYEALGVDGQDPVAVSCGSGVSACLGLLALESLGIQGQLYPGSWSAWSRDPDRPVATGDA